MIESPNRAVESGSAVSTKTSFTSSCQKFHHNAVEYTTTIKCVGSKNASGLLRERLHLANPHTCERSLHILDAGRTYTIRGNIQSEI